jgi:hypothetical protein
VKVFINMENQAMTDHSMDTLHTVMRAIRGETKHRRDHLSVFREFLDHLGKASRRAAPRAHRDGMHERIDKQQSAAEIALRFTSPLEGEVDHHSCAVMIGRGVPAC